MAIEKVKAYFENLGEAARILTFEESTATVELAAEALGVSSRHIAKTLSFLVDNYKFKVAQDPVCRVIPRCRIRAEEAAKKGKFP